jgi:hypothetical protein
MEIADSLHLETFTLGFSHGYQEFVKGFGSGHKAFE